MADSLVSPALSPSPLPVHAAPDMADQSAPPQEAQEQAPETVLPDELLKLPGMMALMAGSPPALSVRLKGRSDKEFDVLRRNKEALLKAGFGFYKSLSGQFGVLFNSVYIHPADIQAADKMGKLEQIAPPADAVHHAIAKSGLANPILRVNAPPGGLAQQKSIAPPQTTSGMLPQPSQQAPAAGGVQRRAEQARIAALTPGGPLTGPKPGAGRLLNQILRPVV